MNNHGMLIVVSGFSGAGKGTLMKELLNRYDNYALSISATTRAPRGGEADGREYFFVTEEHFKEMIETDALIEYARYVNHYYGTPKEYVSNQMKMGKDVILEIEIQGALKVKESFPEAILIFVMPPNAEELKRRLIGRGTESMEVINARLSRAAEEAEGMERYDYILINNQVCTCVEEMHTMIQVQHNRASNNTEFLSHIREELKNIKS
ncbi:MAG: guanylate kinase [Lacrimispora sp.]|uniref:guanylate kinase n=1 Tax=Lacrimispora sp. TaxID=2719234 RepID=UPI0039E21AA9